MRKRLLAILAITQCGLALPTALAAPPADFEDFNLSCSYAGTFTIESREVVNLRPKQIIIEFKKYGAGDSAWVGYRVLSVSDDPNRPSPLGASEVSLGTGLRDQCGHEPCETEFRENDIWLVTPKPGNPERNAILRINRVSGEYYAGVKTGGSYSTETGTCQRTQSKKLF